MEHSVDDGSGGSGSPYGLVDASAVQQLQHLAAHEDEDVPENLTLESLGIKVTTQLRGEQESGGMVLRKTRCDAAG